MAGVGVEATAVAGSMAAEAEVFTVEGSMVVGSMLAPVEVSAVVVVSMLAGSMPVASARDLPSFTEAGFTVAGSAADGMAGLDGVGTIRPTVITTTPNRHIPRPGITAPTLPATTPT